MPEVRLPELHTAAEAQNILRLSRQRLWVLRREGELEAVKVGGRIFYEAAELARFVAAHRERHPRIDEAPALTEASVEGGADVTRDSSSA